MRKKDILPYVKSKYTLAYIWHMYRYSYRYIHMYLYLYSQVRQVWFYMPLGDFKVTESISNLIPTNPLFDIIVNVIFFKSLISKFSLLVCRYKINFTCWFLPTTLSNSILSSYAFILAKEITEIHSHFPPSFLCYIFNFYIC